MREILFRARTVSESEYLDDGRSAATMYRSFEAETLEQAREMLNKECGEKKRACMIKRTYVEI